MTKNAWVDTANQIDNSWYRKTVVAILFEENKKIVSILIENKYKLKIRDKLTNFKESVVVGYLQSYLVFLCCVSLTYIPKLECTFICPDFQPFRVYHTYLWKCFNYHGKKDLFSKLRIKIKPKEIKSKAHRKVNNLYQGKGNPTLIFKEKEQKDFLKYFNKQSIKKLKSKE